MAATGKWAMRGADSLIIWPEVGTDDTIRLRAQYRPTTVLTLDGDSYVFGGETIDDGLNHLRESLLIWRVASRLVTRNRELSQNLEFRVRQAEHELNIAIGDMNPGEAPTTGIVNMQSEII